ncbi:flavodoxin domain-containing protein [Halopseudomonas nanhaiensis]|uniref:flavodoxin domain-containing protein n=1 Tax=Halopseudomonas nanhaiensis TaxID=2830842 RepID=UPI001CBE3CD1|nr:flavodoxin domain-containing protein [Halopseudomonas nanhaiensis]UAW97859.1 flavodoxin domain-containing protein [Halopseudomonas nanhaiensis]
MKLVIISGSVYGTADLVADEAANQARAAGLEVVRMKGASVDGLLAENADALLVCCATTGMGELPDTLVAFHAELHDRFPLLTGLPFGVIALGDSAYGDTFCLAGEQLRETLLELQAREAVPMLRLDASETVTPEADAEPWLSDFYAALQG